MGERQNKAGPGWEWPAAWFNAICCSVCGALWLWESFQGGSGWDIVLGLV